MNEENLVRQDTAAEKEIAEKAAVESPVVENAEQLRQAAVEEPSGNTADTEPADSAPNKEQAENGPEKESAENEADEKQEEYKPYISDPAELKELVSRLNRIEGQVRGVKKMLENKTYCIDVANQASAVSASMVSFNKNMLGKYIKTCIVKDIQAGKEGSIDELITAMQRLMNP